MAISRVLICMVFQIIKRPFNLFIISENSQREGLPNFIRSQFVICESVSCGFQQYETFGSVRVNSVLLPESVPLIKESLGNQRVT